MAPASRSSSDTARPEHALFDDLSDLGPDDPQLPPVRLDLDEYDESDAPFDRELLPKVSRSRAQTFRWVAFHRVTIVTLVSAMILAGLGYAALRLKSFIDEKNQAAPSPVVVEVPVTSPAEVYSCDDLKRSNIPSSDKLFQPELDTDGNGWICEAPPASCADAAALGVQDIPKESPFYAKWLDQDRNGVACTSAYGPEGPAPVLPEGAPNCYSIQVNTGRTDIPYGDPLYQSALDLDWDDVACEADDPVLPQEQAARDAAAAAEPAAQQQAQEQAQQQAQEQAQQQQTQAPAPDPEPAPQTQQPQPTTQAPAPQTQAPAPAPQPKPQPQPTTSYTATVTCSGAATVTFSSKYSGSATKSVGPGGGTVSFTDTGPAPYVSWSAADGPCF